MVDSKTFNENLENFWGTEKYYTAPFLPFKFTDGVHYFAKEGGAVWFLYEVEGIVAKIKASFYSIKVISKARKGSTFNTVDIITEDGNDNLLNKKHIAKSDLPIGEYKFFLYNGVLLLASEY